MLETRGHTWYLSQAPRKNLLCGEICPHDRLSCGEVSPCGEYLFCRNLCCIVANSVLSQFTRFYVEKNLTKNCVCGEKKDKYQVCWGIFMIPKLWHQFLHSCNIRPELVKPNALGDWVQTQCNQYILSITAEHYLGHLVAYNMFIACNFSYNHRVIRKIWNAAQKHVQI